MAGHIDSTSVGRGSQNIRGACWPARLDRLVSQGTGIDPVSKQTRQNGVGVRGGS